MCVLNDRCPVGTLKYRPAIRGVDRELTAIGAPSGAGAQSTLHSVIVQQLPCHSAVDANSNIPSSAHSQQFSIRTPRNAGNVGSWFDIDAEEDGAFNDIPNLDRAVGRT